MAQWSVAGAEKSTGKDATLLVEAPTEVLARKVAKQRGLVVSTVTPAFETPPGEDPGPNLAQAIAYQAASNLGGGPASSALLWASRGCLIVALLGYGLGLLTMALLAARVGSGLSSSTVDLLYRVVSGFVQAFPTLLFAAAAHVASALLHALREKLSR